MGVEPSSSSLASALIVGGNSPYESRGSIQTPSTRMSRLHTDSTDQEQLPPIRHTLVGTVTPILALTKFSGQSLCRGACQSWEQVGGSQKGNPVREGQSQRTDKQCRDEAPQDLWTTSTRQNSWSYRKKLGLRSSLLLKS